MRHLRREEPLQAADPLDLGQLIRDPLLKEPVPARELFGLLLQLVRLQLHRIVKVLDPQQRSHARHQCGLLERLRQIVITAGLETVYDVARIGFGRDQNDGDKAEHRIALELLEDRIPSSFGIMTSSRTRSGSSSRAQISASSPSTAVTTS